MGPGGASAARRVRCAFFHKATRSDEVLEYLDHRKLAAAGGKTAPFVLCDDLGDRRFLLMSRIIDADTTQPDRGRDHVDQRGYRSAGPMQDVVRSSVPFEMPDGRYEQRDSDPASEEDVHLVPPERDPALLRTFLQAMKTPQDRLPRSAPIAAIRWRCPRS
jgi:hypothetical protein